MWEGGHRLRGGVLKGRDGEINGKRVEKLRRQD
jgi:hypothetical protein